MRILIGFLFLLFVSFPPARAEEEKGACDLQNKRFCGVWNPVSTPALAGGKLTIQGRRLAWENGDYAECDILDEENGSARPLIVLKCIEIYDNVRPPPDQKPYFYMFRFSKTPRFSDDPDGEIRLWRTDILPCLFSKAFYGERSEKPSDYYKEFEYFTEAFRCYGAENTAWTKAD